MLSIDSSKRYPSIFILSNDIVFEMIESFSSINTSYDTAKTADADASVRENLTTNKSITSVCCANQSTFKEVKLLCRKQQIQLSR